MESWSSIFGGNEVGGTSFLVPTLEGIGRSESIGTGDGSARSIIVSDSKAGDSMASSWQGSNSA